MGSSLLPPFRKPLVSGSVLKQTSVPWITAIGVAALRSDFDGYAGGIFEVGAAPITVTHLGRIFVTGNTQSHDVGIFASNGDPLAIVAVNCASGVNDQFNYSAIAPLVLSASTQYIIASLEVNAGDQWYNGAVPTTTAVAASLNDRFRAGSGTSGAFSTTAAAGMFVPCNFKYLP